MKIRVFLWMAIFIFSSCVVTYATIDSLWSSPNTTGTKGALYEFGTNRIVYYYALDSAAGVCRIYNADNFTQVYSPSLAVNSYTYLWHQYIGDASGNGHPEALVYEYNTGTYRYSTRIVDMSTGAIIKSWSSGTYSYFPKFMGIPPGSSTIRLGIERSNGTTGSYPSSLLVYSLGITGVAAGPQAPDAPGIALEQSYPNTSADHAVIEFTLPRAGRATVTVYNQLGQAVRTVANREFPAGKHTLNFDGRKLAAGAYFYRLATEDGTEVRRLLLVK